MTDPTTPPTNRDTREGQAYIRPKDVDNRSTFLQRAQWSLETFAWDHVYWNRFRAMDIDEASNRAAKIFRWMGPRLGKSAHSTATRNLKLAFPDWSDDQIEEMALRSWENFGHIAGELPHHAKINCEGENPRMVVRNGHIFEELTAQKQPAVIISGHFSNWEILAKPLSDLVPGCEVTYRSINNPHIDARIAQMRLDGGVEQLAAKSIGTRNLMRALSKKRSIALMNDQKFREGLAIKFFGHDAMTAPGPTRLAHKYKAPIVPFRAHRTGPARYEMRVYDPIWPDFSKSPDDAIAETLPKIVEWTENCIREAPEQWFWQHNRWPKSAWADAGII